jgi:hypothetical protein
MNQNELHVRLSELEAEVTRLREERIPHVDRSSRRRDQRLGGAFTLMAVMALGLAGLSSASALDGTDTVFSDDIVDGTVSSLDVKNNAIITSDIKDGSIGSRDIADDGIASADIANGTIGSWDVADGTIGGVDIIDGDITSVDLADGSIGSADVANGSIKGEDLDLYGDNQCSGETVQGTAFVNGDPAVPNTFTTNWLNWQHSCSGAQVRVQRVYRGKYVLDFGSPTRSAVATLGEGGNRASIIVRNTAPGVFEVLLWDELNGQAYLSDYDFSILAY